MGRGGRNVDELDETSQKIPEPSGTSIFDPVLCELAYRWFCPDNGLVLDPFAGGSVRGIVASKLGYQYVGIELRAEQVAANRVQADDILSGRAAVTHRMVRVSVPMANLLFHGCDKEYIETTCHAKCCESSSSPSGTLITIHPSEQAAIEARGGVVEKGLLVTPRKKCTFKTPDNLCGLHFTLDKPFGCIASPFTINSNDTLIVRNRYKMLKCYKDGANPKPAYVAFRASLDLIFGQEQAEEICAQIAGGASDVRGSIPENRYRLLKENDAIKHGEVPAATQPAPVEPSRQQPFAGREPEWICGDSGDMDSLLPAGAEYDFVFSCPPYADLERYSDDPKDLSTMPYEAFVAAYRTIISKAVAKLKDNRFVCLVVGDIRDKKGFYRNFVGDTIQAVEDAGATLYNEAILVTAVGSLPIRVGKQFSTGRKLGKTHQNVLVFYKGDPKKIRDHFRVDIQVGAVPEGEGDGKARQTEEEN
jgi:DNA modification methylase